MSRVPGPARVAALAAAALFGCAPDQGGWIRPSGGRGPTDLQAPAAASATARVHEPPGYTPVAEHAFDALPSTDPSRFCDSPGVLAGCAALFDPLGNYRIVVDESAPWSAPGVLELRFVTGLEAGAGSGLFRAGDANSEAALGEYAGIYESLWVRVPAPDFELQRTGVKLLGFIAVGQRVLGGASNQVYFFSDCGACPDAAVRQETNLAVIQQNHIHRRLDPNVATGPVFTFGSWHHVETVMTVNDIGAANGTLHVWVDGELVHAHTDVEWRDAANPAGFYMRHFDPIWGGMGGSAKSRDDRLQIDHLYLSGIPLA